MKRAILIAGMAYGDEGKGTITDYCCKLFGANLVVRYNGGSQAAHNVVTDHGILHTFSQFGSGTLRGVKTHLSRYTVIDPIAIANEAETLESKISGIKRPLDYLTVSPMAPVVTPIHAAANRIRELARRDKRHGSVGLGIGEVRADQEAGRTVIFAKDVKDPRLLRDMLKVILDGKKEELREYKSTYFDMFRGCDPDLLAQKYEEFQRSVQLVDDDDRLGKAETVVFEGAQGMLLDQTHGFAPYNSYTDITFSNAERLIKPHRADLLQEVRIGVIRSFFTRHGPGPFVTEDPNLKVNEVHNKNHAWMGNFRLGHFDAVALRYAINCIGGLDGLAVTHLDCQISSQVCVGYTFDDKGSGISSLSTVVPGMRTMFLQAAKPVYRTADDMADYISRQFEHYPILIKSFGPAAKHKTSHFTKAEEELWGTVCTSL